MKTSVIAFSAAVLIAAAPVVLAQNAPSKTSDRHNQVSRSHLQRTSGYVPRHPIHAKGSKTGYPGAFGYAPGEPKDYMLEGSRQAGGGGGGGGGGM